MICGIVLSGGASRRFQRPGEPWVDKALYPVEGKPMIAVAIERLSRLADEIVIAGGKRARIYEEALGVRAVEDAEGLSGPLAGIYAALLSCEGELFVAIPNDMPYLESRILEDLVREAGRYDIVSPTLPNGVVETTVIAGLRRSALWALSLLRGRGRSKVADLHRGSPSVLLIDARGRGYSPRSFINVNKRESIGAEAGYPEGPIAGDVEIIRDMSEEDVSRGSEKIRGSLWGTLMRGWYADEFLLYARKGAYMFAAYALMDSPLPLERELGRLIIGSLRTELI